MLVFDASTLVALFDAYTPVYRIWRRADQGLTDLGFPTVAMVEAGRQAGIRESAWDSVLWSASIKVLPLGEAAVRQIGLWTGSIAARHAVWESRATGWPVFTRVPDEYAASIKTFPI